MTQILIDTDVLIDLANGDAKAKARIAREHQSSTLFISTITIMELVVGCRNKRELQALNRFLRKFQTLNLSGQISEIATQLVQEYYLSHGLLIADALIAATAIDSNIPLLSKNQSDFRFISTLSLLPYP